MPHREENNTTLETENLAAFSLQIPAEVSSLPPEERQQKYNEIRSKQVELISTLLEQVTDEHIEWTKVPFKKTESDPEHAQPSIENKGLVDVQIDMRAFLVLLKVCGLEDTDIQELELSFNTARLTHRDFNGNPTLGTQYQNTIEAYTSVPDDYVSPPTAEAVRRIRETIVMIEEKKVANTLAHEMRHYIQRKLNMYPEGMASYAAKNHDELPYEADAIDFGNKLSTVLQRFIQVKSNPVFNYGEEKVDPENPLVKGGIAKPEIAAVLMSDDDELYLLQKERAHLLRDAAFADESQARGVINKMKSALNNEKIGFGEYRMLLQEMVDATQGTGNLGLMFYVQAELSAFEDLPNN